MDRDSRTSQFCPSVCPFVFQSVGGSGLIFLYACCPHVVRLAEACGTDCQNYGPLKFQEEELHTFPSISIYLLPTKNLLLARGLAHS